ncbi:MAG TPA: hypothetical protein VHC72_14875, partial [Bryobacteraceae bacterium]|nr:hypothetical protein [Bryobacteraceae bacterium]
MKARRRLIAPVGAALLLSLWMAACGGLPRDIRSQIDSEKAAIVQAEWQLQHSQKALQEDLDHSPDLFRGAPVATEWPARLQAAKGKLEGARNDLKQLDNISGNDPQSVRRARQLLTQERGLRQSVISESQSV